MLLVSSFGLFLFCQYIIYSAPDSSLFAICRITGRTFFSFFSALLLVGIVKDFFPKLAMVLLNNRQLILLGKISYGIYIYHMFTPGMLKYVQERFSFSLDGTGIYMPLNFIVTFGIAYISYRLIEKPINGQKRKFNYK